MLQLDFFEVQNIVGVNMTQQMKVFLEFFKSVLHKIIAYVKDERSNLTSLTTTLILVISCFFFFETCHSFHWFLFWACYI
jgi:hypothetical protein